MSTDIAHFVDNAPSDVKENFGTAHQRLIVGGVLSISGYVAAITHLAAIDRLFPVRGPEIARTLDQADDEIITALEDLTAGVLGISVGVQDEPTQIANALVEHNWVAKDQEQSVRELFEQLESNGDIIFHSYWRRKIADSEKDLFTDLQYVADLRPLFDGDTWIGGIPIAHVQVRRSSKKPLEFRATESDIDEAIRSLRAAKTVLENIRKQILSHKTRHES